MLSSVKSWWSGSDSANDPNTENENETVNASEKSEQPAEPTEEEANDQQSNPDVTEDLKKAVGAAKEWGSYFYSYGKKATVAAAKSVTSTAKQLKSTVDTVGDKVGIEKTPVIGEFTKEQKSFVESRRRKKAGEEVGIAPWCGYDGPEAEELHKQILSLSGDERNFLRHPPKGAQFTYDADASAPVAMAVLAEDPQLREMRFKLVPKKIKEEIFWRNYFYRVSLIRQSTELYRLAHTEPATGDSADGNNKSDTSTESYDRLSDVADVSSPAPEHRNFHGPHANARQRDLSESEVPEGDFVSDSNADAPTDRMPLSTEERRQLGMSSGAKSNSNQPEADNSVVKTQKPAAADSAAGMEEWEAELQRELNEFELVEGGGNDSSSGRGTSGQCEDDDDADLEREIMEQLEADEEGGSASSKQ